MREQEPLRPSPSLVLKQVGSCTGVGKEGEMFALALFVPRGEMLFAATPRLCRIIVKTFPFFLLARQKLEQAKGSAAVYALSLGVQQRQKMRGGLCAAERALPLVTGIN